MRPRTDKLRATVATVLTIAGVGFLAPNVQAGTYDVPACDAAGGVNNSWAPSNNAPGVVDAYSLCPSGGDAGRGMVARSVPAAGASAAQGAWARMAFNAPPGTAIIGIRGSYDFQRTSSQWEAALSTGSQVLRGCFAGLAENCSTAAIDEWTDVPAASQIYVDVFCAQGLCDLANSSANARVYSAVVRVEDDQSPTISSPGGGIWSEGWKRSSQSATFSTSDNTGIRINHVLIDGQVAALAGNACDYTFPVPCSNVDANLVVPTATVLDGVHQLSFQTTDAAGNVSQLSRAVQIDNTPPGPPRDLAMDSGEGWRSSNGATVRWTNPPTDGNAPIAGADWELCREPQSDHVCVDGHQDGMNLTSVNGISVPRPGDWVLSLWLRDAAGNTDQRTAGAPLHFRYDNEPPTTAAFDPIDPADPTRVAITGADATSGVVSGRVEIKSHAADAWRPLTSRVEGGKVVTNLPDEQLKNGTYDLRGTVTDQAGNERSTTTRTDGTAAQATLPVRSITTLTAQHRRVSVRYGGRARLSGRLRDAQKKAMAGVPLEVWARTALTGAPWRKIAGLTTSKTGRFSYRTRSGPSRTLRIRYSGTPTIRPDNADTAVRVTGSSTITARRRSLRNGQRAQFSGTVRGQHVRVGKLVQLQTMVHRRWQTFATARVSKHGKWQHSYRFIGTHGTVTYRFRAHIPSERGFPYRGGNSKTIRLHVRGP